MNIRISATKCFNHANNIESHAVSDITHTTTTTLGAVCGRELAVGNIQLTASRAEI